MPRIRTIKPEFWQDEKLAEASPIDRLVFIGLISQADDAGRVLDNVKMLDGLIFPFTIDSCASSLETLARLSRISRYTVASGSRIIQIVNWGKHQRVDHPSTYVLPPPDDQPAIKESRETLARSSRSDQYLGPVPVPTTSTSTPPTEVRVAQMDQKQWIAEMMAMWPTVEPTAKGRPEPFLAKLYSLSPAVATDVIEQVFYGEKQFDGSPRAYVLSAVKQRLRAKVEAEEKGEPLDDYDAMRAGLRALDIDQESRRVAALHTTELRGKPEAENE